MHTNLGPGHRIDGVLLLSGRFMETQDSSKRFHGSSLLLSGGTKPVRTKQMNVARLHLPSAEAVQGRFLRSAGVWLSFVPASDPGTLKPTEVSHGPKLAFKLLRYVRPYG